MNARLYVLPRATAALMVPLVVGHLATIFYATGHGLSAAEILGRTRGSSGWGLYYALFVLAASIHGAIGMHAIIGEWTTLRGRRLDMLMCCLFLALAALGALAVAAMVLP